MEKVKVGALVVGDIFSRSQKGDCYYYTPTGTLVPTSVEDMVECYCLDSEKIYPWDGTDLVYLQYREGNKGMDNIPVVYKALIRTKEGKLVSLWAGRMVGAELTYKEGEVTYAPEGSLGIFVDAILEGAKGNGMGNWERKKDKGYLVIHEATPLGIMLEKDAPTSFAEFDRYPAILLGKEVYSFGKEPEKPKEEWVDITRECTLSWITAGGNKRGYYLQIHYDGTYIACLGVGRAWVANPTGYKIECVSYNYLDEMHTFRVLKKVIR